jgi:acyl carrier protein
MLTDIESKIFEIIANQFGVDPAELSMAHAIVADLGADSLDTVEITMDIERVFKIAIQADEAADAITIEKIIKLVKSKVE